MPHICFFSLVSVFYLTYRVFGQKVLGQRQGGKPPSPPTPPSPYPFGPLQFVYQSKAIFAISLKRFLAQHEAPKVRRKPSKINRIPRKPPKIPKTLNWVTGPACLILRPSHYQNEIIVYQPSAVENCSACIFIFNHLCESRWNFWHLWKCSSVTRFGFV